MITLEATIPCLSPPAWAFMERRLIEVMDEAVYPFLEKYTNADGTLIWRDVSEGYPHGRDGADDFYESSCNWPLLYLLGGGDHLLTLAHRQWDAITRQLTAFGVLHDDYERGYDQFHQAEGYISFHFLCLADPTNPRLLERARRFAALYLNENPTAPNYDAEHRIIRAPHNGSGGPRWGVGEGEPRYEWSAGMATYGLPFADVPGITAYDDLKDPAVARRMGEVMLERMGRGDVVANLGVTSLLTNAYLLTGDDTYRRWVAEYVDAWVERAHQNGGLLPDNVGLSGLVGEYLDGKWYGGLYGWTWPHGFYTIAMAAIVAGTNAYLLTREPGFLDLPRSQIDAIMAQGEVRDLAHLPMSLEHHWVGQIAALGGGTETFVVPYRYGDAGWFDYQPMSPIFPLALWNISRQDDDWQRIERIRQSGGDWARVFSFRTKEESGHEPPWTRYLAGDNPGYPAQILAATYDQVCRRLDQIRRDDADLRRVTIHHWQELNPVLTEALVQLTLGAPQPIYNGGLLHCALRYFDEQRQRPGLPRDIAALVERLDLVPPPAPPAGDSDGKAAASGDEELRGTMVHLVNLSPFEGRTVIVQAGAFSEHRVTTAHYTARTSEYPGPIGSYSAPEVQAQWRTSTVGESCLHVHLPAASEITLDLAMERFVNNPSYQLPWDRAHPAAHG